MADYQKGTSDPTITPDAGAGQWDSEDWTFEMVAKEQAIFQILPHAYKIIGPDATTNMYHYLGNSGKDLTINLEKMLGDVENERKVFENEMLLARKFVETLPVGTHQVTSGKATSGYALKRESWNWFFATGGYAYWGKGTVAITENSGVKSYDFDFEYKFFDRYNWDGNKEVEIFGITVTDEFMGRFHREGLAQEYNMYGSVKRNIKWTGTTFGTPVITNPGGR